MHLHLRHGDLMTQALNTLAIGIFWLEIAKFGLIAHAHVPFAESQADLRLIERLYTQPLPEATLAPNTSLRLCALKRVLQQGILIHLDHAIANLHCQELTYHRGVICQRLDEDVEQKRLRQARRNVVTDEGEQRSSRDVAVAMGGIQ